MSSPSITIGVCAMEKKANGKPMKQILQRLENFGFTIVHFEERVILEEPIEAWPLCDCLIAFYSGGYPLAKAEAYSDLRKPYVVNDLHLQWALMDRIKMYEILQAHGVPTPKHVVIDHTDPEQSFVNHDDHVVCRGTKLKKPLVEKPQDGDDHNVCIYWPHSSGGGCTNLFRKVDNRSSEYVEMMKDVRKDGVYLYEEFVNTHGVDVKVYTCGPDYAHAEARRAPAMDGRVRRNERGKEERYPVILSETEKSMAQRVVLAFKQTVCGLDLLRSKSGSVVCDVNGWSFVKDSTKYWDDTAHTLSVVCQSAMAAKRGDVAVDMGGPALSCSPQLATSNLSVHNVSTAPPRDGIRTITDVKDEGRVREKLVGVSVVARHADRTPKQKMKMLTRHPALLAFCDVKSKEDEVKIKQTADLQKLLEVAIQILDEGEKTVPLGSRTSKDVKRHSQDNVKVNPELFLKKEEADVKGESLGARALTALSHICPCSPAFSASAKLAKEKRPPPSPSSSPADLSKGAPDASDAPLVDMQKVEQLRRVLEMSPLEGLSFYRKVQLKPKKFKHGAVCEMMLILKWGGKLTWAGKRQSIDLGHGLRVRLYPARETGTAGAGGSLLRLHATYRHDLKIYTSDEGRVILTAAAFAKGLLDLEGALPPISAMMLQSDEHATEMLDILPQEGRVQMDSVKAELSSFMHGKQPQSPEIFEDELVRAKLDQLGCSPCERMKELQQQLSQLVEELAERRALQHSIDKEDSDSDNSCPAIAIVPHMDHSQTDPVESMDFVYTRWRRLHEEFYDVKKKCFDISKIPDIYDCSLYDILHNGPLQLKELPKLHELAQLLANFLVPLEYGITDLQKATIGINICDRLVRKLCGDLHKEVDELDGSAYHLDGNAVNTSDIANTSRRVHTRLYFTSESHIISLLNVIRWGHVREPDIRGEPLFSPEMAALFDRITADGMAFLTHLVLSVHESFDFPQDSLDRFRIRILFSPGANSQELNVMDAVPLTPPEGLPLTMVNNFFQDALSFCEGDAIHSRGCVSDYSLSTPGKEKVGQ